jgi:alcohol dehydrogenase class IV
MSDDARGRWFTLDGYEDRARGVRRVDVLFGRGRVAELRDRVTALGRSRVMLVTGPSTAADDALMSQVRAGLGDLVVGEYTGASSAKRLETIYAGIDLMRALDADLLLGIGGGSSLDTARQISAVAADGRPFEFFRDATATGTPLTFQVNGTPVDVVVCPTTLAGADLTAGGSFETLSAAEAPDGIPKRINPRTVGPTIVVYDPALYATTPETLLVGSAVNGLNKGIETVYSPRADAFSDAVSVHGTMLMARGLLALRADRATGIEDALAGLILVQMRRSISVVHAFGHAIARFTDLQQGVGHAIIVPHVLEMMLRTDHLRRDLLASVFRTAGATRAPADDVAILEGIVAVRDALGLPRAFGDVLDTATLDIDRWAHHVVGDPILADTPLAAPLTHEVALGVYRAAL